MAATKNAQVNTLNIFLIIFSLVLAYIFPFELFILAYAILGPLHYVTEINWLEKKNFFSKNRLHVYYLILITFLISVPFVLDGFKQTHSLVENSRFLTFLREQSPSLALAGLMTALCMIFTRNWLVVTLVLIGTFVIGIVVSENFTYMILLSGLLPTIFHVYLFTLLFMLYGAIKESSKVGFASVVIMAVVPAIIVLIPVDHRGFEISNYFLHSYDSSHFQSVNYSLGYMLGQTGESMDYRILTNTGEVMSEVGLKIQIFIAFAYTYHYLNWFSKTTVIGWHKVISKNRLFLLGGIWLVSVLCYMYNYYIGFLVLLFLSYLHVLMEFPLNWVSIKEIGRSVFRR